MLHPGEFVLGGTMEYVAMPDDLVGRIEGKSSLGRLGLMVHSTAGYVDPGFEGKFTLELANIATLPILLWPTMKIGQLSIMHLTTPCRAALRNTRSRQQIPGSAGIDAQPGASGIRTTSRS